MLPPETRQLLNDLNTRIEAMIAIFDDVPARAGATVTVSPAHPVYGKHKIRQFRYQRNPNKPGWQFAFRYEQDTYFRNVNEGAIDVKVALTDHLDALYQLCKAEAADRLVSVRRALNVLDHFSGGAGAAAPASADKPKA